MEFQSLMCQYHSDDLYPCWRQLQGHNGMYDFKSPPAAKTRLGPDPFNTRFRPYFPLKVAKRRIPSTVHVRSYHPHGRHETQR